MNRAIAIILFLCIIFPVFATGPIEPNKVVEEKFVNALVALILEIIDVLETVLETDINPVLRWQIMESIIKCREILGVLTN